MARKKAPYVSMARYGLPDVSMPAIRRYARAVAERFRPDKVILFGSFAYGEPTQDSDVDLLVVMPCANHVTQAVRIETALEAPFPMDLIVRSPEILHKRIQEDDRFLIEVTEKGKVLYEKANRPLGSKGRKRRANGRSGGGARSART